MKIGVVTFHRAHNCGAALQCAALVAVLKRMGHSVEVVDCNNIGESRWPNFGRISSLHTLVGWIVRVIMSIGVADCFFWRYSRFRARFTPWTSNCIGKTFPDYIDRFIVGSDQVYNPSIIGNQAGVFLLNGIDDRKRYTYAASFGAATLPQNCRKLFADELSHFSSLGFRESSAISIIHNELGLDREVSIVLDPTLLLQASDYFPMERVLRIKGKFIVIYWAGRCGEEARKIADYMAHKHGLKVVFINQYPLTRFKQRKGDWIAMTPDCFLWLMHHAEFVISTSFHGTAFAIINHKPFIVLRPSEYDLNERVTDLLNRLGIPEQVVYDDSIPEYSDLEQRFHVDYAKVEPRLALLRDESMAYLAKITS